jgi:hypothetical protein
MRFSSDQVADSPAGTQSEPAATAEAGAYRWRVCLHESAHAYAARLYGLNAGGAYVDLDRDPVGKAHYWDSGSTRADAIVHLSGCAAETVAFGNYRGGATDGEVVHRILDGDQVQLNVHWESALTLVCCHYQAIDHIARWLFARDELSGPELDWLYARIIDPRRKRWRRRRWR